MARSPWWASGYTRRIPVAAVGGVTVILSPPSRSDAWSMASTFATANRAIGDTTLTLSASADFNLAEAWATLRVTANRLVGLYARIDSHFYRITAHSAAAELTFVQRDGAGGLVTAMTAEVTPIFIQADLPNIIGFTQLAPTVAAIRWSTVRDTTTTDFNTIPVGQTEVIHDADDPLGGVPAQPIFLKGDVGADTTEARCAVA